MATIQRKKHRKVRKMVRLRFKNVHIQRVTNGGEKQIGNYLLDGFCPNNKTIYEFHGCYWQGCQKCYTSTTFNTTKNCTMMYANYKTVARREKIQKDMPDTCHDKYFDFTSLYPAVKKQEHFPKGHPEIITSDFGEYQPGKYFGLVKCTVNPPRDLYFPVLPARINKKLIFGLCTTCAIKGQKTKCNHTKAERAITGTWPTPELDYAVSNCGYTIESIQEIWHWSERGELFTGYVNACIKEKQEASGFPAECITEEDKQHYIDDYFQK